MGAIWFLARSEMRHRWVGAVVLIVLVGVVGGAFLASAAGARRTSSALSRFESETDAATLEFNVKNGVSAEQLAELKRVPGVAQVGMVAGRSSRARRVGVGERRGVVPGSPRRTAATRRSAEKRMIET